MMVCAATDCFYESTDNIFNPCVFLDSGGYVDDGREIFDDDPNEIPNESRVNN